MANLGILANKGVRTEHPYYVEMKETWKKCRDVVAGEDAMHNAKDTYIFKLKDQMPEDYTSYVLRTPFYNATSRTLGGMLGMLFRKDPVVEVPDAIEEWVDDIDLQGTTLVDFLKTISEELLTVGRVGVFVDYTVLTDALTEPLTIAKAEQLGLRPIVALYRAEDVINWRFSRINNVWSLAQVVLREVYTEPAVDNTGKVSEFENSSEDRYRVLDIDPDGFYRNREFRINKNGKDELVSLVYPLKNGQRMQKIPFEMFTDKGLTFKPRNPPLLDLINVNVSHYRTSADYEHGCHFTGLPTFFISGYKSPISEPGQPAERIMLGSQSAILLSDPQAKAGFAEFTGQGLKSLQDNLDRKENQMAVLGARMIAGEKKAAETATTTAIHRTGENSVLSAISISASNGMTEILTLFVEWGLGSVSEDAVQVKINKDFLPVTVDGPTLTAYVQAWQAGGLKDEEFFDLIQRGDLVEADVTFEQHQSMPNTGKPPDPVATPSKGKKKPAESTVHNPENPTNAN